MSDTTDTLFTRPRSPGAFRFDEQVAEVFPDMLRRSVPGYGMMLDGIRLIARRYVQPGSRVYDLGCSLGAASLAAMEGAADREFELIGVDSSTAMIQRCEQRHADRHSVPEWLCGDIREIPIENASLVMLNLTLQFIPLEQRHGLIEGIAAGLRPGGVLLLSEKIRFDDSREDDGMTALYHDFKRANGYSDMEISTKREALENVLIPETLAVHRRRLRDAGLERAQCWFQCFNFASLLAWKS